MTQPTYHDASFIVRIWWEGRDQATAGPIWRGQAQHVATGEVIGFYNLEQLGAFLRHWTGALSPEDRPTASIPSTDSTGESGNGEQWL